MAALAALVGLSACDNLDEKVVSGVTGTYLETPVGLEAAVNAAYSGLQDLYGQEREMTMQDLGTDIWTNGYGGSNSLIWDAYSVQLGPSDAFTAQQWELTYVAINTTNAVIARAAKLEAGMSEAAKAERVAEARFLRGMYYFYLVRMYGDVYVSLDETQGVVVEAHRTPKAEIYANVIIPDLEAAVNTLPLTQTDYGRATRGAAQHLLALVYLTRAEPGDLEKAEQLGKEVIDAGQYSLLPNYGDIFALDNDRNAEVIFSVQYTHDLLTTGNGNRYHLYWLMEYDREPGMHRSIEYGRPWVRIRPTELLLHLHDRSMDVRYEQSFQHVWYANQADAAHGLAVGDTAIFLPGVKTSLLPDKYKGKNYEVITEPDDFDAPNAFPLGMGVANVKTEYDWRYYPSLTKHMDPTRVSLNEERGRRDVIVYRLADTYLMVAEALVRQGKLAEAVPFLNAVRERAAKPGMKAAMAVSPEQVNLDFVLDERARELFGEGHRWFDLVRNGVLVDRVTRYNPHAAPNIKPYHVLRPIPQTQIDRTKNEDGTPFGQNPGY
jgi:hypothetical protein